MGIAHVIGLLPDVRMMQEQLGVYGIICAGASLFPEPHVCQVIGPAVMFQRVQVPKAHKILDQNTYAGTCLSPQ